MNHNYYCLHTSVQYIFIYIYIYIYIYVPSLTIPSFSLFLSLSLSLSLSFYLSIYLSIYLSPYFFPFVLVVKSTESKTIQIPFHYQVVSVSHLKFASLKTVFVALTFSWTLRTKLLFLLLTFLSRFYFNPLLFQLHICFFFSHPISIWLSDSQHPNFVIHLLP